MTSMEQIEYIAVEARKMGISFNEWRVRFGHTLPKPEPTKYKEHAWYEGMDNKEYKPRKKKELICEECGAPFVTTTSKARWCPQCRIQRQRNLAKERRRRVKEND